MLWGLRCPEPLNIRCLPRFFVEGGEEEKGLLSKAALNDLFRVEEFGLIKYFVIWVLAKV